ncbi:MAG: hypothetical protein WEB59_01645 [Thermoanaerobaculia bacterium]
MASAQKLGANARSQAAPAEAARLTPDSRLAVYTTAHAAAAQTAEKRLRLHGSGRNLKSIDQSFPAST